jgi:hypothetical protein
MLYRKWEESGFELYEGMTKDYMNGPIHDKISAPRHVLVDANAIFEELKSHLYLFHDNTRHWPENARKEAWASWLSNLDNVTGPLHWEGIKQFISHLSESSQGKLQASLQEVEDTQAAMRKVKPLDVDFKYYEDGKEDSEEDGEEDGEEDSKESDEPIDSEELEG